MGLDFCAHISWPVGKRAHWSYSGFNQFRGRLAKEVGFNLDQMRGFGGDIEWSTLPPDDIHLLLNHSDCEGELTAEECNRVIPRLDALVRNWPDDDYDKIHALRLIEFMSFCLQWDGTLEFC
jgi:hypothetical protein